MVHGADGHAGPRHRAHSVYDEPELAHPNTLYESAPGRPACPSDAPNGKTGPNRAAICLHSVHGHVFSNAPLPCVPQRTDTWCTERKGGVGASQSIF